MVRIDVQSEHRGFVERITCDAEGCSRSIELRAGEKRVPEGWTREGPDEGPWTGGNMCDLCPEHSGPTDG